MNGALLKLIMTHMHVLVEDIGPRPGGSAACQAAEAYLLEQFAAHGWSVEQQPFDCPAWQDNGTMLRLGGRLLQAKANAYSPPCKVLAESVQLGTLEELEAADIGGRIAVLYGALLPEPLSPKSWFLKSERDDRIIRLLEKGEPAAIITVQQMGGGLERLIEDWEFTIPSATVDAESGRAILEAAPTTLELIIDSTTFPSRTANIVARRGAYADRVVVCAHHDTKIDTPGACDNASGVSVLLALASSLRNVAYPYTIELVSFANEEYLPIGDDEYLRHNGGDDLSAVVACINIDGVGQWLAPDSIAAMAAGQAFEGAVRSLARQQPDLLWAKPWPQSNHSTFSFRGVPSVAFTSASRVALAHHPQDNLYWSNPGRIVSVVNWVGYLLRLIGDQPQEWTRAG